MWLKITSKINANRPAKNKLTNQKKSRLKADGLLDPPLKEMGLRKAFVQVLLSCVRDKEVQLQTFRFVGKKVEAIHPETSLIPQFQETSKSMGCRK
jgi:hypothetical protein